MTVTFRTATADDVADLDAHPPQTDLTCDHAAEVADTNNTYLLGFASGTLAAHGFVRWTGFLTKTFADALPGCAVINSLCVWPRSMRRKGIGTAMVVELEHLARTRAVTRVALGVYVDNVEAQAFYQSLGYDPWDGQPVLDEHADRHPDGFTMMSKVLL